MSQIKPYHFIGISVLSFVLILWLPESLFAPLNRATAELSGLCLALFRRHADVAGDLISLDGFRVKIITECTSLYATVLFATFVCSAPASMKKRAAGLLLGGSFLFTANILRIALVAIVGAGYPALFEIAHVYLAQVVMLILVIAASLVWLRWAVRSDDRSGSFLLRVAIMASFIFPLWLAANVAYVRLSDRLVAAVFALANYRVFFTYEHPAFFQTFNVVLFAALMLADKSLPLRCRIAWGAAGTAILAFGHLLFRIGNVLLTGFAWQPALPLTIFLNIFGEYLLPVFLWIAATRAFKTIKEQSS